MSTARFSPFELLLLKSRSQVDTATLLLLGWVLVHRQHVSEGQRRRRLAQVTSQFRHGHELGPVMSIAHSQDLHAIQLAAEVVRKECSKERSLSVMHQAITVATDDGDISLANHYILRFLADLLNVAPATLGTLFQELTGQPLIGKLTTRTTMPAKRGKKPRLHNAPRHRRPSKNSSSGPKRINSRKRSRSSRKKSSKKRTPAVPKRGRSSPAPNRKRRRPEPSKRVRSRHAKSEHARSRRGKRSHDNASNVAAHRLPIAPLAPSPSWG